MAEGDIFTRKILTKDSEHDFWDKEVKHDNIQKEYLLFPRVHGFSFQTSMYLWIFLTFLWVFMWV